jgi:excisionase family DNA binding protein
MTTAVATRFLTTEDVAERYGISRRTVHELTRRGAIAHRIIPGTRRCLFDEESLRAWEDGCELERIDLHNGGRIVRPVGGDRE